MIPMITPYKPIALPKISTISIFINVPFWLASVRAAPDPIIPTPNPHAKFVNPTINPAQNTA